jgi:transposase InsO family protein
LAWPDSLSAGPDSPALSCPRNRGHSSQYTSIDYTQTLADHRVLASVGSVGDAYDNALAESFVDSFKTELIADRVWRTRSQLELAVVEYVGWYNAARLHESLGDVPPLAYEQQHALREATTLAGASV